MTKEEISQMLSLLDIASDQETSLDSIFFYHFAVLYRKMCTFVRNKGNDDLRVTQKTSKKKGFI